jgi:hypothetical protein
MYFGAWLKTTITVTVTLETGSGQQQTVAKQMFLTVEDNSAVTVACGNVSYG